MRPSIVLAISCASARYLSTTADVQIQQTFAFDDSEKQFIATVRDGEDPTHDWGSYSDVDLAKWLERPILASTHIWEVGRPFPQIYFNPWSAFLDSPSVAQKLSNFYLLRCKMHMKIIVNGSQMHYGRGFVSYRPLITEPGEKFQFNELVSEPFSRMDKDANVIFNLTNGEEVCIMTQSQWPKIFIDPGQSMGGEMEFPFFYGANWFRIPNRDWVANPSAVDTGHTLGPDGVPNVNLVTGSTPNVAQGPYGARISHMGVVHSSNLANLKHANDAEDPVTIQVFLWASDVKFSIPTAVGHPAVSIPPSLAVEPKRGTFIPHMRSEYVPNYLGDLAKANSSDISTRLEVGDSCLATHEATVGLGASDEMSIPKLAQRECWLDRFTWPVDAPAETAIWYARVTPQYFKRQIGDDFGGLSGIPCVQPTPSAYAALPFGYWRGSMKYRIQIVASNLHRGRLRIVYDPVADVHAREDVNDYPESLMNQQYSRTIDIAGDSGRDFTFEVGYMQEKPYLALLPLEARPTQTIDVNYDWVNYGSNVPVAGPTNQSRLAPTPTTNGQITIYVLNRLAVPNTDTNNDVTVNVFVSAGEDMDFQMPTARNLDSLSFTGPTGFPVNWRNGQAVPQSMGNEAVRRANVFGSTKTIEPSERAKLRREAAKNRKAKSSAGVFIPKMEHTTGESAAMGTTEMEDVPEDPPTKAWMGDCSQPAAPMASITFGEKMHSWRQLMDRWQIYNRETYTGSNDIGIPIRADRGYTVININPDFPPFPGPAPIASLWDPQTSDFIVGVPDATQGPFVSDPVPPGVSQPLANNFTFNWAPAAKYTLAAPIITVPTTEEQVDAAELLRVNPGKMTMLHFVTRMFIGRKGAINNKYVLDGNRTSTNVQGTKIMSVKRLPDSGVLSGNTWVDNVSAAQDRETTTLVRNSMPAYGGYWSQASCRVFNSTSGTIAGIQGVGDLAEAQALNGSIQTGSSQVLPPNWFDPLSYPSDPNYGASGLAQLAETVTKSDLMMTNTFDGTHVTTSRQQPVIEVEIPFYVNSRFIKNDLVLNNTRGVQAHAVKYESVILNTTVQEASDERGTVTYLERHVRPGKDFSLYYLANVPHIVLLGHFQYNTVYGDPTNIEGVDTALASYSSLRYFCAGRQSESAYKNPPAYPSPPGSVAINSYPSDTYFYEQTINGQVYPMAETLNAT